MRLAETFQPMMPVAETPKAKPFHHAHLVSSRCEDQCPHCSIEARGLVCEATNPINCVLLPEYHQRVAVYRNDYSMLREAIQESGDADLAAIHAALLIDPEYAGVLSMKLFEQYISGCVVHEMTQP